MDKNIRTINYPIEIIRGDTYSFCFKINSLNDLEISEIYMTCKEKSNPDGEIIFQRKLLDGINKIGINEYKVQIERANTINMNVETQYMYDIEIKYDSVIKTIINGEFKVNQDYTNPDDEESDS